MPRISIDNYDTIASWNGSQDLFIVEQPDGTKVATPAMVKQFIEAGDFEATGDVKDGHGNVLADMAKLSDVSAVSNRLTIDVKSVNLGKNQSATIEGFSSDYWAMMCICYIPGEGGLILGFRYHHGTSWVINLLTGNNFTSNYVDFNFDGDNLVVTSKNYTGYRFNFFRMPPYTI